MKTQHRKRYAKVPESPLSRILRKVKRFFLLASLVLFLSAGWWAYSSLHSMTDSAPGRVVTWGAGAVMGPAVADVPLWAWGIIGGVSVFLWWRHKLVMALVFGVIGGVVLAVLL
ncbi:hypothetical protein GF380_01120 [Candidatus Uhrbacteria bacterium]|nr:hypothetical protein [Candidatus Uhrbacteria bacterium]